MSLQSSLALLLFRKLEHECELGAETPLWLNHDVSTELHGYHFWNMEAQSYTLCVDGLGWIKEAKQLE